MDCQQMVKGPGTLSSFKDRLPFIQVMPVGLSYGHSSSTEYTFSFKVINSDAKFHRSKSHKKKWLFF